MTAPEKAIEAAADLPQESLLILAAGKFVEQPEAADLRRQMRREADALAAMIEGGRRPDPLHRDLCEAARAVPPDPGWIGRIIEELADGPTRPVLP